MKLCVYKIGGNVVLVFKIPKNYKRGIFIKENYQKVFYRRNVFGSYKYNDPEEIVEYCINRNKNKLTINDILENL